MGFRTPHRNRRRREHMTDNRLTAEEFREIDRVAERFSVNVVEEPPYTFTLSTSDRGTLITIEHVRMEAKEQDEFVGWTMGFLFCAGLVMNLTRRVEASGDEGMRAEIREIFRRVNTMALVGSEPCRVEIAEPRLQELLDQEAAAEGTDRSAIGAKAVRTSLALHAARFTRSSSVS